MASKTLREHVADLHKLAAILIERETIDKDQFERLLAGESQDTVFPAEIVEPEPEPEPEPTPEKKPAPRPTPRAIPGAAMQPPPDPAAS